MTAAIYLDHSEGGAAGAKKGHGGGRRRGNRTVVSASMEGDIRISEEKSRMMRSDDGEEENEVEGAARPTPLAATPYLPPL